MSEKLLARDESAAIAVATRVIVLVLLFCMIAAGFVSCRQPTIAPAPEARRGGGDANADDDEDDDDDDDDDDGGSSQTATGTQTDGQTVTETGTGTATITGTGTGVDDEEVGIDPALFPRLELAGTGKTKCKEDLATTTRIATEMTAAEMTVTRTDAHVACWRDNEWLDILLGVGGCDQAELDAKVRADVLGTSRYRRATKEERQAMRASGTTPPPYAVLAMGVTSHKGVAWQFDKPLPVFPWPAPLARYTDLDQGPQTFRATAVGPKTVTLAVKVEKVETTGTLVKLRFTTSINNDVDRNAFHDFPMPRTATYQIDTTTRDVRAIDSTDWFTDQACQGSGVVQMTYRLCKKTVNGQTQDFGC
jgi:hypothetical protein